MSTTAIPVYQPRKKATAEFTPTSIVIKKAYRVNGTFYDLTYETNNVTVQKLRRVDPHQLVQTFQQQMEAYLNDKDALLNPEEVSLEWTDEQIATIFQDTWGAIDAPAEDDASLEGVLKKSVSGALEGIRVTAGTVSKLNLLTYGPVPNLSSITGGATLASGLIGVGQKGYEAYSAFKEGKAAEGMESVIKTTAAGAEVVTGIAALGAGSAMMGPIACAVAAGTNLLINFKDLFLWASEDK
ncbi:MAG TPA: hypothetical protein VHL30_00095, partial [Chlamydiales bacterium]|nr:hypothetical protein [Chlamydiales bacterium]